MEGWEKHYPGMIQWHDPKTHGGSRASIPKANEVKTDLATHKAALVNVLPAQMAGRIARDAGLADQSGFCPIDPESMKSKMDANVFVLGDACIPVDMPKSAFSANSQAKVAAMAIRGELTGSRTFPARHSNTCWSLIAPDDDVKVGGSYEPGEGKIKQTSTFVSQKADAADIRQAELTRSCSIGTPASTTRRVRVTRGSGQARDGREFKIGRNRESTRREGPGGPCLTDAAR